MEDQNDILSLLDPTGALRQRATGQARGNALTALGLGLLRASRGQPGQGRPSTAQAFGEAGPGALQAYQQSFDKTLADALRNIQVQDLLAKRKESEQIRRLAPQLFQTTRAPSQTIYDVEGETTIPGAVTGVSVNRELLPALGALGPAGMQYATQVSEFAKSLQPKTSIQSIFNNEGQEVKVRYNEDTGQYSQLGGAKAESLVQIDLGNMVELRTPTGAVVGRIAKGAAPKGPSFSFNESTGLVIDQNTGAVSQPRDTQGNLVDISQFRKPSESQEKQVIGVQNTRNAIGEFRNELSNFTRLDTLKPTERARIETKYRNMLMQAKEAYNLGVLNGPDLAILEQIIYNPTSMKGVVVGKEAIDAQASELDRIMGNIKSTVQARGGAVPQTTSVISKTAPPGVRQELWDIMSPESKKLWSTQK
jgi:hypothetical protein